MTDFWTDERIDTLKRLRHEGAPYSEIAQTLGCSRNAAIAKAHRVGLGAVRDQHAVNAARRRKATNPLGPPWVREKRRTTGSPKAVPAAVAAPGSDPVHFRDVGAGQCRWPLDDAAGPGMACCGAPVVDRHARPGRREASHCAFHLERGLAASAGEGSAKPHVERSEAQGLAINGVAQDEPSQKNANR